MSWWEGFSAACLKLLLRNRLLCIHDKDQPGNALAPHHNNRRKPPAQDGRARRRYRRRWTVERTFAWLGNFRHLIVRDDRSLTVYRGFFHIACFMVVLRRVLK